MQKLKYLNEYGGTDREIECEYLSISGHAVQIWNGIPFELVEVFVMNFGERLVRVQ